MKKKVKTVIVVMKNDYPFPFGIYSSDSKADTLENINSQ